MLYTLYEEHLLNNVERLTQIKFERSGPPQISEMMKAAGCDAAEQIANVSASLVPFFSRIA